MEAQRELSAIVTEGCGFLQAAHKSFTSVLLWAGLPAPTGSGVHVHAWEWE